MSDSDAELLGKMYDLHTDLTVLTCGECHIRFAIPRGLYDTCMEKDERGIGARAFYCPNGHRLKFHKREIDELRQERDLLKQRLARVEDEKVEAERALASNLHRAASGVCPCCRRTFRQLALHMEHQHPELVSEHRKPPPSSDRPVTLVRKVRGKWTLVVPTSEPRRPSEPRSMQSRSLKGARQTWKRGLRSS